MVVANRLDDDEVNQIHVIDSMGRDQLTYIVNEAGLYSVIIRSDKPEAKAFRRDETGKGPKTLVLMGFGAKTVIFACTDATKTADILTFRAPIDTNCGMGSGYSAHRTDAND